MTDVLAKVDMLGQRVNVRLTAMGSKPVTIATGELLAFDERQAIVVRDDRGIVHFCWPALAVERA